MDDITVTMKSIGTIHTPFQQGEGTPIQPARGKGTQGWIELDEQYVDGLKDLNGFERIWVLFWCDRAGEVNMHVKPYMDTEIRGMFSTRTPCRPNAIGISCVKLVSIEGNRLNIEDVDMLDGTPLLDIKPYVKKFDQWDVTRCGWTDRVKHENTKADNRFYQEEKL